MRQVSRNTTSTMKNMHILKSVQDILLRDIDKALPSIAINQGSIFVIEKDREDYTLHFANYTLVLETSTYDKIRLKSTSSI